jgi:hypothetical protein
VTSLYGLLGVSPDASADEIRRAYYRSARQLHPDVNPQADAAAAMRRLNDAWAILGDPVARRRYDAQSSPPAPAPFRPRPARPPEAPGPPGPPEPARPHPPRFVRPSALIVAVLLVIFVVTAYAGHGARTPGSRPTSTPSSAAAPANTAIPSTGSTGATNLLGECLQSEPGYDAVVPCGQPNLGEVVMLASASAQCPAGTRPYQLIGRPQWVCLRPGTSG